MASSTKAADSNIEIKRYAALGGAFGTSAVRLCLPRCRQEEPDTGWEVHCLLGARWPPKIRRTLKQKQVAKHPKIRKSVWKSGSRKILKWQTDITRWSQDAQAMSPEMFPQTLGSCDATDCGLRCLILSQCLQTRPINYSQEVRQPQSLRPPLTWQIICIVRRYQEGLNSTRFKGRSNKIGKSSSVTCPEFHRTILKNTKWIQNESPKVASLNVCWNLSRLLLSLSDSEAPRALCPLRPARCYSKKSRAHCTRPQNMCAVCMRRGRVGVEVWGMYACMNDLHWFAMSDDGAGCIATRAGLRMLSAEATKDKHKTWDLKTWDWAHTRHGLGGRLWLHLTFEESNCHQVELLPSTSPNWSHRSDKFGSVFTCKKKTKAKRDLFSPVSILALNNFR